tara:strand:+ start:447 stop:743 length:297 start_codon:yes stop_codon:yes gene_type:complete
LKLLTTVLFLFLKKLDIFIKVYYIPSKNNMKNISSSIEDEKYFCMLNRLNGFDLIKHEQSKQIELGIAEANNNLILSKNLEKQLMFIDAILEVRSIKN